MKDHILTTICNYYQLQIEELSAKKVRRQVTKLVEAKQVCIYLLCKYTKLTGGEIAKLLGYSDGSGKQNVNASKRSVKKIAEGNHAFRDQLVSIEKSIIRE
jgi:chromosomal replication initiation ATPase DnaA